METLRLGGAIYPTIANVNHSCDPNVSLVNWGNLALLVANQPIRAGEQIFDTYGAICYHMTKEERQKFLRVSLFPAFLHALLANLHAHRKEGLRGI